MSRSRFFFFFSTHPLTGTVITHTITKTLLRHSTRGTRSWAFARYSRSWHARICTSVCFAVSYVARLAGGSSAGPPCTSPCSSCPWRVHEQMVMISNLLTGAPDGAPPSGNAKSRTTRHRVTNTVSCDRTCSARRVFGTMLLRSYPWLPRVQVICEEKRRRRNSAVRECARRAAGTASRRVRCRLRRDFSPAWRGACVLLVVAAPECSRCIGNLLRILRHSPSLPLWARHPRSATRARKEEGQEVDDRCRRADTNLRFPLI